MDAFSLSLALGTLMEDNKKQIIFTIVVGILHFLMPIVGIMIGDKLINILNISSQILISAILILIAFEMLRSILDKELPKLNLKFGSLLFLALSVSFDSFSVGIGIKYFTSHLILSGIIFAILSSFFTYIGLRIGKYAKKHLGVTSNIIGAFILIVISFICLCQ